MEENELEPEDEIMKLIMIQIQRYKKNQLEFFEAFDDFFLTSDKIIDE